MNVLRRVVRKIEWHLRPAPEDFSRSYSQQGEDMILRSFFQAKPAGFYVDVGAHHPVRLSNTYHFYLRGWMGINVDAMPGSMTPFRSLRPRDVNLEAGVAAQRGTLPYYRFAEPAVNGCGFTESQVAELDKSFRLLDRVEVATMPLREILWEHVPSGVEIDFLNVDVEGLDLVVLQSNDWDAFRPTVVVAEDLAAFTLAVALKSPISGFMRDRGYDACAKCHHSILYVRRDRLTENNIRTT